MANRYQRGNRLSYFNVCLLITPLLYVGHCIVYPTSMYIFWLPHWFLLAIVSSVLLQCISSDYHIGISGINRSRTYDTMANRYQRSNQKASIEVGHTIQWPTDTKGVRFMPSGYHIGIFWQLYRLSYFDLCLLITTLVSVGHCIVWHWSRTDDTMPKRYQCGNQKAYIEVGQTIQWPTDTNVVIRRYTLK
jgi:hypothetical protein